MSTRGQLIKLTKLWLRKINILLYFEGPTKGTEKHEHPIFTAKMSWETVSYDTLGILYYAKKPLDS